MRGLVVLLVTLSCAVAGSADAAIAPLARGRELFDRNLIADALPHFQRAVAEAPGDADARAWLAETWRRLGEREEADAEARAALALQPCHAFAHDVLNNNSNPQYGDWPAASRDSSWAHARRAVECDPSDGNAWLSMVYEASRRGDRALEDRALRRLVTTGFLTRAALAFGRWTLRDLPDSAILIVNGDMDTYPTRALQVVEGLRTDVAIVNISMMEEGWYRKNMCQRHGLASPFDDLDDIEPISGPGGTTIYAGRRMTRGWFSMFQAGTLGRPLAVSTTVADLDFGPDAPGHLVLKGAFWLAVEDPPTRVDTGSIRAALLRVKTAEFAPPWTSCRDRSPVRRTSSPALANNLLAAAQAHITWCRQEGREPDAAAMKRWAVAYARDARMDTQVQAQVAEW
jgi:tetratricopeptide (TPR) repeat protein